MTVYHLSACPLGVVTVLRPRLPRDPMPGENRTVRRISAASTIGGCLRALQGAYYNRGQWYVYVASIPDAWIHEPIRVPDAKTTGERWILEVVEMIYAGRLVQIV